jgi:hypothetical protein
LFSAPRLESESAPQNQNQHPPPERQNARNRFSRVHGNTEPTRQSPRKQPHPNRVPPESTTNSMSKSSIFYHFSHFQICLTLE